MKNDIFRKWRELEEIAQKATESTRWINDIAETVSRPSIAERLGLSTSFSIRYPRLSQLGLAQTALDCGLFKEHAELAKEVHMLCEPYRTAIDMLESYNKSIDGLIGTKFSDLLRTDLYAQNIATAMQRSLLPVLEEYKINTAGMSTALVAAAKPIDTSWLTRQPSWMVKASDLLSIETDGIPHSGITALLALEKETSRVIREINTDHLISVAAQIASITQAYSGYNDKWRELIAPFAMIDDLQGLAFHHHQEIQKERGAAEWHLGLMDAASRFVDRQVTWTNELIVGLEKKLEPGDEDSSVDSLEPEEPESAVCQIPQYIGYTKRRNVEISPEEGLKNSSIVEVTEKGKKIVENAVTINELAASTGKPQIFRYTGKMMVVSANIGSLFCSSKDLFGTMIDGFYMMFYENLEHIKDLSSDKAVREEEVYQCIFRVKDMRTDLRHDYEHGKNIEKKRRDISECYRHYTNRPVLVQQKDYVSLQRKMYDEFLALEEHLISILCAE